MTDETKDLTRRPESARMVPMDQHTDTDQDSPLDRRPSEGVTYTFGGKIVKKTLVDDLLWELGRECKKLGFALTPTGSGYDIQAPFPLTFDDSLEARFGVEIGYCSSHYLTIVDQADNGNYSPPRLIANIRKALKALRSGEQLLTECTTTDCDECEAAQE